MTSGFTYVTGDEALLNGIQPLWEALTRFHMEKSLHFKEYFNRSAFADKKTELVRKARRGVMHVAIAYSRKQDKAGYCVGSVVDGVGEIDSLFVADAFRGQGLGHELMDLVMDWLRTNGAKRIVINVAVGNEEVLSFYAKYGLYPRSYILQAKDDVGGE